MDKENVDPAAPQGSGASAFGFLEKEEAAVRQLVLVDVKSPPFGYLCNICNQSGHFVQFCPNDTKTVKLTPYQGSKQCYGQFRCPKCRRTWGSGNSYADCSMNCKKCGISVYPHKQLSIGDAVGKGLLAMMATGKTIATRKFRDAE